MEDENSIIVLNHTHPEYSNDTQEQYLGMPGSNHQADYLEVAESLPDGFDLLFTVTNHFETEGQEYWEKQQEEVERRGGEAYLDDLVFRADLDGTRIYGLHGVEAADQNNLDHEYLIHGLELDDDQDHTYEDFDEMLEVTQKASVGTVPHPFFMDYNWGEEKRDDFFETASNYDTALSIEHSLGYGLLNNMANSEAKGILGPVTAAGENTADLCEEYEVPAVPGIDWHASAPKNIVLMDYSAVDKLESDKFPTKEFLNMQVSTQPGIVPESLNALRNTAGAMGSFADMLPIVGDFAPDTEEFYQGLRDRSLEFYSDLHRETVTEDAVRVNGPNGLLDQKF